MTRWWADLLACPRCGVAIDAAAGVRGTCPACALPWSQADNVTTWDSGAATGDERLLPAAWIAERRVAGFGRAVVLAKRAAWRLATVAGLPVRILFRRRVEAFQQRAQLDRALADDWHRHYLGGLELPDDALIFEYSYRKHEKVGFTGLLGYRIVVQDVRTHPWWRPAPHVSFQVVPVTSARLPLKDETADVVFADGVMFDMRRDALASFLAECHRILKPGKYMVAWAGNSLSRTRAQSEIRWHGRIHSLDEVRRAASAAGFTEIDASFEGYAPPIFPAVLNVLGGALAPWSFRPYPGDSWLARRQRPARRAYWLLRLAKTAVAPPGVRT